MSSIKNDSTVYSTKQNENNKEESQVTPLEAPEHWHNRSVIDPKPKANKLVLRKQDIKKNEVKP